MVCDDPFEVTFDDFHEIGQLAPGQIWGWINYFFNQKMENWPIWMEFVTKNRQRQDSARTSLAFTRKTGLAFAHKTLTERQQWPLHQQGSAPWAIALPYAWDKQPGGWCSANRKSKVAMDKYHVKWTKHWYTLVIGKWKFIDVALFG